MGIDDLGGVDEREGHLHLVVILDLEAHLLCLGEDLGQDGVGIASESIAGGEALHVGLPEVDGLQDGGHVHDEERGRGDLLLGDMARDVGSRVLLRMDGDHLVGIGVAGPALVSGGVVGGGGKSLTGRHHQAEIRKIRGSS